jgi:DNA-binding NtrC family response regulator
MPQTPAVVLPFNQPQIFAPALPQGGATRDALLGPSAAMERLWSQMRRVAPHFRCALVSGEPGTGAEAAVRALHELSPHRSRPLVVLNALDAELQLGNTSTALSPFAQRMVYLPEAERLTRAGQMGVLRVLRLRGPRAACVVAHVGNDLRAVVSAGGFSVELAGAFSALRVALPALRERKEDLPTLVQSFVSRIAGETGTQKPSMDKGFLDAALAHDWQGNLDELDALLRHLLGRGAGMAQHGTWNSDDFSAACEMLQAKPQDRRAVRMITLEQLVQEHIRAVLLACQGNKLRAAEVLGISRSTLYRMLESGSGELALAG